MLSHVPKGEPPPVSPSQPRHSPVTPLPHPRHTVSHPRDTPVTPRSHPCSTPVTPVSHPCKTLFTLRSHPYPTHVTPPSHPCFTPVKSLTHFIEFQEFFPFGKIFKPCDFYRFSILHAEPVRNVSFNSPDAFAVPKFTDIDGSYILQHHVKVEFQYKHRFSTQDPNFDDFLCFSICGGPVLNFQILTFGSYLGSPKVHKTKETGWGSDSKS